VYSPLYWLLPALFVVSVALWPVAKERARLRTSLALLGLATVVWLFSYLPSDWLPAVKVIREVSLAFVELAIVQVGAVIVFDLVLRKVRVRNSQARF